MRSSENWILTPELRIILGILSFIKSFFAEGEAGAGLSLDLLASVNFNLIGQRLLQLVVFVILHGHGWIRQMLIHRGRRLKDFLWLFSHLVTLVLSSFVCWNYDHRSGFLGLFFGLLKVFWNKQTIALISIFDNHRCLSRGSIKILLYYHVVFIIWCAVRGDRLVD